jgi:hypothetical protein
MDVHAAKTLVQMWLSDRYRWAGSIPQIVDGETIEHDFGWVFHFRLPHTPRPRPGKYEDTDSSEFPPVAENRHDGTIKIWRIA